MVFIVDIEISAAVWWRWWSYGGCDYRNDGRPGSPQESSSQLRRNGWSSVSQSDLPSTCGYFEVFKSLVYVYFQRPYLGEQKTGLTWITPGIEANYKKAKSNSNKGSSWGCSCNYSYKGSCSDLHCSFFWQLHLEITAFSGY